MTLVDTVLSPFELVLSACTNALSLVQQLAVLRWLPTPGSPAAAGS